MSSDIYYGPRGDVFKCFISNLLKLGSLKEKYIDTLLTDESLNIYSQAFTSIKVNPLQNYEYYELLGDSTVNKSIVLFLDEKYPLLRSGKYVKIIAEIKKKLQSATILYKIGKKLNFLVFISASEEQRKDFKEEKQLIADVVEAFIGATEYLLNEKFGLGVGFIISYNIVKQFLKEVDIQLTYEYVKDVITRIKESFDWNRDQLDLYNRATFITDGNETKILSTDKFNKPVEILTIKVDIPKAKDILNNKKKNLWSYPLYESTLDKNTGIWSSTLYNIDSQKNKISKLGQGQALTKTEAEQAAAEDTYKTYPENLRPIPDIFLELQKEIKSK